GKDGAALVRLWRAALDLASSTEEDWRKKAGETEDLYLAEAKKSKTNPRASQFNILYTNTETLVPALYNSRPEPDCRRRFLDDDPIGKLVAQLCERAIIVTIDRIDFDNVMLAPVTDSEVAGRGTTRVRYVPRMQGDQLAEQRVEYEHIDWRSIRLGPAKRWDHMPWIAFEHFMTREQLIEMNPQIGATIKLESNVDGSAEKGRSEGKGENPPEIFKRAHVWEIWDREQAEVLFIADSHPDAPLRVEPDPMELEGFFPMPRPLYGISKSSSMVPTCPFALWEAQALELEDITRRLKRLVKILRWRGAAQAGLGDVLDKIKNLDDGELAPVSDAAAWDPTAGLDKAFWLMPIEAAIVVIEKLYLAREAVKQTIYEITGVADVLRGVTNPNETLGAQQLKAQWGSLRLNRRQQEVARYARDLFRLTAEVVANKFSWEQISLMTGIKLPSQMEKQQAQQIMQAAQRGDPQAQAMMQQVPPEMAQYMQQPSVEEVMAVLRRDLLREYRVDIESDSTIRADMERAQTNLSMFMQGMGTFLTASPAAIEAGFPPDVLADLMTGFARYFKLGKKAEDALDRLGEQARKASGQPRPDPAAAQAQMEAQARQQELALKKEEAGARLQFEQQKHAQTLAFEREKHGQELQLRGQEMTANHALAQQKAADDAAIKREGISAHNGTRLAINGMRGDYALQNEGLTGQTAQLVKQEVGPVMQEIGGLGDAIGQGLAALGQAIEKLAVSQTQLSRALLADNEVIRDKATGRAIGTRRIMQTVQ
ncbi:MAG TPA: hypothetical protein VJ763_10085, partial [Sphingomicrobium sp.]|nr:hypothetical protein [Sphingomicrobium sp.]